MPRSSQHRRRRTTLTGAPPMSSSRRGDNNVSASLLAASVVAVLSLGTLVNPVDGSTGSVATQRRALGAVSLRDSIPTHAAAPADDEAVGGNASGIDAAGEEDVAAPHRRRLQSMAAAVAAKSAPAAAEAAGGGAAASVGTLADRGFAAFDADHNGAIDRTEYDRGVEKLVAFLESPLPPPPAQSSKAFGMPSIFSAFAGDDTDETHFWPAFVSSAGMIIATEIGDKTFFIAAVLSMRNDRGAVFLGALFALVCMTVLSTMMGLILPSILPRQYTSMFGAFLFLYFGVRLINDSRGMSHRVSEELEEVEEELLKGHHHNKKSEDKKVVSKTPSDLEAANGGPADRKLKSKESELSTGSAFGATSHSWEKVFVQSLTLTFLAEWGDRSQIATIALAAHKDPYGVTFGGCLGHSLCTGVAVVGGRMLASRISEKTVSLAGGIIFLVFGVHSLFFE